jgi:hypothetical protein
MALPIFSLDLNSSGSLQYYGGGDLDFEVGTNGDALFTGPLDMQNNNLFLGDSVYLTENTDNDLILQGRDPEQKLELTDGGSLIYREYTSTSNNVFEVSSTGSGNGAVRLGEAGSTVSLDMNGNNLNNFFGSQCSSGNVATHVNDDGTFDCVDATGEVSGDFVSRTGDTMTGDLDMQSNQINNIGSGNINIGDGSGDINMNGNRIYDSSLGQFQSAGVSGTLSNAQNNLDTLGPNSLYVADDVSVGGDFIGAGGDVAENIKTEDDRELEPGTVTTISGDLEVKSSTEKRDTAVAGIVSTDPGVKLAKERDGVPLALSGIVPVKTTMENGEIEPGDLMTTSSTQGHAMKCNDSLKCHGAIIGKAMGSLSEKGKVQVLVTLG